MPACRTRWWRCATAPWAGTSPASTCEHGKRHARRPRSPAAASPGPGRGRARGAPLRRRAHRPRDARALAQPRRTRTLYLFDVRDPDRIRRRPRCRRALRAGRPARAGDRPVCRHARRAHRAGRRRRGARGDDGVVAEADGLDATCSCWSRAAPRPGRPARPVLGAARRPKLASIPTRSPVCWQSERRNRRRPFAQPRLPQGHIPGAWFAIRARLAQALATIPLRGTLVLTSEDGVLACLAVAEARALTTHRVITSRRQRRLAGRRLPAVRPRPGWPTSRSTRGSSPTSAPATPKGAMSEYLAWETDLLPRIDRDGSCRFSVSPQQRA